MIDFVGSHPMQPADNAVRNSSQPSAFTTIPSQESDYIDGLNSMDEGITNGDPIDTTLHEAIAKGNSGLALYALRHSPNTINQAFRGLLPIHLAAAVRDDPSLLVMLIAYGADPNARTTSLHQNKRAQVSKSLSSSYRNSEEQSASVPRRNRVGHIKDISVRTPLSASIPLPLATPQSTVAHSSITTPRNSSSHWPRQTIPMMSTNSSRSILLTPNSASPKTPTEVAGITPLHYAVINGHANNVLVLLMHSAFINIADSLGKTPESFGEPLKIIQRFPNLSVKLG